MKRSKFTEEQIIGILREQDAGRRRRSCAAGTGSAARRSTLGRPGSAGWRANLVRLWSEDNFERREAAEGARGGERQTEAAAGGLPARSGGAEGSPVAKVVTPAARREAVAILVEHHEMSERRACAVVGADRTSIRYRSRRPDDHDLRERLRALASERRRFGYRRPHVSPRREGHVVNRKKIRRSIARRASPCASDGSVRSRPGFGRRS